MWYDNNYDTIFANREVNAKFRAWHDWMHIKTNNNFSLEGEKAVYAIQSKMLPKSWQFEKLLLKSEIVGQAEYYSENTTPIPDQRKFTLNYIKNENYEFTI